MRLYTVAWIGSAALVFTLTGCGGASVKEMPKDDPAKKAEVDAAHAQAAGGATPGGAAPQAAHSPQ